MVVTLFPFFFFYQICFYLFFYRESLVTNLLFFLIGGNCSMTLCFLSAPSPPHPSWFPRDAHHSPAVRSSSSCPGWPWLDIGWARSHGTCGLCWGSWRCSWAPPAPPAPSLLCPHSSYPLEAAARPSAAHPQWGGYPACPLICPGAASSGLVPGGLPPRSDLLPESSGPRPYQEDLLQPRGECAARKTGLSKVSPHPQ